MDLVQGMGGVIGRRAGPYWKCAATLSQMVQVKGTDGMFCPSSCTIYRQLVCYHCAWLSDDSWACLLFVRVVGFEDLRELGLLMLILKVS